MQPSLNATGHSADFQNAQEEERAEKREGGQEKTPSLARSSKSLVGDQAQGNDLVGLREEAYAIADTIAFKELQTPFVVGILGGWGSGKSSTFGLIMERLKEIQKCDLTSATSRDFPYVGHIYLILFDAWTYAKGSIWESLMFRILTSLNDQLDLEATIGLELLMKGVSLIELMDQFTASGERVQDESVKQAIREWTPRGGHVTEALIDATNSNYGDELKKLQEKKRELEEVTSMKKLQLAWEQVSADENTSVPPNIRKLLKKAYENDAKKPRTVDHAINNMIHRRFGMFWQLARCYVLSHAGSLTPLCYTLFLSLLAIVIPLAVRENLYYVLAIVTPIVFLSALHFKYENAKEKLESAQEEINKVAREMHLNKKQVQEALEKSRGLSDTKDEEKQQDDVQGLNVEINSLQGRTWLRKGDSLNMVVGVRLGSPNNYEEYLGGVRRAQADLGVVHHAQSDLLNISNALMCRDKYEEDDAKKFFPRGDPRIVLFIDDLDRCPQKKVVETLEAVQLLVKTKLFVVVLAIDPKYVTLCLEKEYEDILHPERHPSGLDYIEKIIQLPYRVPPISNAYMKSNLQEQTNAEKKIDVIDESKSPWLIDDNDNQSQENEPILPDKVNVTDKAARDKDGPLLEAAKSESEKLSIAIPTEAHHLTSDERKMLEDVCVFSGTGPRSSKRLVNAFKLMKMIWHLRNETPGEGMKEASVLTLALCASSSKRLRRGMSKILAKVEQTQRRPADCINLKEFIKKALGEMGADQVDDSPLALIYDEQCIVIFEKVKWMDDEEWNLTKKNLRLVRSFSLVEE